jgi:glutathionylspermidine synthase
VKTRAWPLDGAEVEEVFRTLRLRHCKWDIYHRGSPNVLADAIVLSEDEHAELVDIAEGIWRALREVEAAVCADRDRLRRVGISPELIPMVTEARADSPRLSRCDFHLTRDGQWQISELNEDGPSGLVESAGLQAVLLAGWAARFEGLRIAGDLERALRDALAPFARVGLVYPTAYSEALQHVALVAGWLEQAGQRAIMGSPANLVMEGEHATLFGERVDALFRYFPGEWIADLPNADDWTRASPRVPMLNSMSALVAQSKRFYAAAADEAMPVAAPSRALIAAYIPATRYFEDCARDDLLAERERWVLKAAFGRAGDAVRLGIGSPPETWARALDSARDDEERCFAVQQYFDAAPLWFSDGLRYATVGVLLVDGKFAGYYSRAARHPVINYDASHVPTLVEAA